MFSRLQDRNSAERRPQGDDIILGPCRQPLRAPVSLKSTSIIYHIRNASPTLGTPGAPPRDTARCPGTLQIFFGERMQYPAQLEVTEAALEANGERAPQTRPRGRTKQVSKAA